MSQTMQSISNILVEEAQSQFTKSSLSPAHSEEPEPEDNISLLFSVANDLNNLCITLEKIDHILKMKTIELRSKLNEKEQASPQAEPSD